MESRFIIVVVFASLVQCSLTVTPTDTDGISDGNSTKLGQIIIRQNNALRFGKASVNDIFNIHEDYLYVLFGHFEAELNNSAARVAESAENAKASIDPAFDAIQIALGGPCAAIEQAQEAVHDRVDEVFALVTKGWELGTTRNYSATQDQIRIYEIEAQNIYVNMTKNFYDSIRTCINHTNPIVLAALENGQKSTALALRHLASTFFSGTKLYATADPEKRSLISVSRDYRNQALAACRNAVESAFAGIRALALVHSSKVNNTEQLPAVFGIQYAQIIVTDRLQGAVNLFFDQIRADVIKVIHGINDSNVDYFSLTDARQAKVVKKWTSASNAYFDSALAVNPNISEKVVAVKETFAKQVPAMVDSFFEAFDIAMDLGMNNTESLEKIITIKDTLNSNVTAYVEQLYILLKMGVPLDSDTEAQLESFENGTSNAAHAYINRIFNSTERFARNVHAGEVSEGDLAAIQSDQATANSDVAKLTGFVSESELLLLNSI